MRPNSAKASFVCSSTVALLLLQFALVSLTFPLSELTSEKPLLHIDAPLHLYQSELAKNVARDGNLVGYDPYFGAGYPSGVNENLSARVPAALSVFLAPWMSAVVAYKIYSFFSGLLAVACVPLAAYFLGLSARAGLIASMLGLFLWWVSVFRWYHTAGMVSFVTAAYAALPYVALLIRYLHGTPIIGPVTLGLLGAVGMFYHPLFPVPVAFFTVFFVALSWREISHKRLLIALTIIPLLSISPNLLWLYPAYHYGSLFPDALESAIHHQQLVDINLVWQELLGRWNYPAQGSKAYLPIALLSAWACLNCRDATERGLIQAFTGSGVLLVLFAFLGAAVPGVGDLVQPNRFAPVGYLMMIFPAAWGLENLLSKCGLKNWRAIGASAGVLLASIYGAFLVSEVAREVSSADVGHYAAIPPEVKGLGPYSQWLLPKLKKQTGSDARVLFETSNGRVHDGGHMAGYYAYTADREFIGGPYPFLHFASFWDGRLLNRPVSEFSPEEFSRYADLYNIGWMVLHTDASKEHLGNMPHVTLLEEFGKLQFYRVDRDFSFFLQGNGRITARSHNRLRLSDLSGHAVVLKYHYVPGMRSEPPTKIDGIAMADDPIPFIKLSNPPSELTLYLP